MSVTALLQSGTSPPLESHYGLGQLPADERDAGCQVATQPLHDKALGQRHSVRVNMLSLTMFMTPDLRAFMLSLTMFMI